MSAVEKYSTVVAEASRLQYSQVEIMAFQAVINDKFAPKFHVVPKDVSLRKETQARYTEMRGEANWQEPYCRLCKKFFGAGHEHSTDHAMKIDEMTAADEMIGAPHPASLRRFGDCPGLPGFLSQNLLKSFWGSNVEAMVALVYDKLAKGAKFEAAIPGWGKHKRVISVEEVTGIGMGAVTYPGDGKYNPCLDVAVRWEDMLQDLPPADKERFERLIDDDCRKEGGFKAPEGRGWWPICIELAHGGSGLRLPRHVPAVQGDAADGTPCGVGPLLVSAAGWHVDHGALAGVFAVALALVSGDASGIASSGFRFCLLLLN